MNPVRSALLLIIALFLINSCKRPDDAIENDTLMAEAVTYFSGSPAVDACGWLLFTTTDTLSPVNLNSEFQTPNQKLRIRYRVLQDEFSCGWARYDYKVAELIDVEKLKD